MRPTHVDWRQVRYSVHGGIPQRRRVDPLGLVVVAMLVAVLLAACSDQTGVRTFNMDAGPNAAPYPVALRDETGLVVRIEPASVDPDADFGEPVIRADPSEPKAFFITWLGIPAHDALLEFKPFQDGYLLRLELRTGSGFPGGGPAIAVPGAVRIVTSRAIPIDSIQPGGSAG